MRAIVSEFPFEAEITFAPRLGVRRDNRHEQRALLDLPANALVPRIAAAQFALIEPHFDARRSQGFANTTRSRGVLGRVAEKNGALRRGLAGHDAAIIVA